MARELGPIVFVVVVVGGLGSIGGAFVASLAIGLIQTLAIGFDVPLGAALASLGVATDARGSLAELWSVTLAQVAPLLPYLLLIVMLIVRPRGLAGRRDL